MSRSCRARWTKPRRSRPVARWRSGSSSSRTRRPARAASIVIRTSHPNPGAAGKHVFRAAGESERWPESGSRVSSPAKRAIKLRAIRFATPKPPPTRSANTAMFRSAPFSTSGARSPDRSASQSRRKPGAAARSAADSACPFPRRRRRSTTAPASSATSAVRSREPSSATSTSAAGNARRSVVTLLPITDSSSRAATRIVSGSSTRGRRHANGRKHSVVGGALRPEVSSFRRIAQQNHERELADTLVDVVNSGEMCPLKRVHGRIAVVGRLDADSRDAEAPKSRIETLEEPGGRARLRFGRADEDDAVRRFLRRSVPFTDDQALQRVPQRGVDTRNELLAEGLTELVELMVAGVRREKRSFREALRQGCLVDRHLDRPRAHRRTGAGIAERTLYV